MPVLQRISLTLILIAILGGCSSLPEGIDHPTEPQTFPSSSVLSVLAADYQPESVEQGTTAVSLQESGWDALAQRLALVESAEHTIDIQYYIWNSDESGSYLASRLLAAADRGVKVRVMLDDINLNEREGLLSALDAHPNIEIRIFNPTPTRRGFSKWLSFLGDFSRLNRRMHNKSFTVDSTLSVVGGRNIGDEYFDLSDEINFRDRDVMVMGSVVTTIQASFIEYWNSRWSYPVDMLGGEEQPDISLMNDIAAPHYLNYPKLPEDGKSSTELLKSVLSQMTWVNARFVYDPPVPIDSDDTNLPKATAVLLADLARKSEHEILLESAYLVFDDGQLDEWQSLSSNNVEIKALTNSMASNDLVTNHSAYAGRRYDMLDHGIDLFELKPESNLCEASTQDVSKCAPETAYGLHAKSVVFDRSIASIGSFNFNLRSTYLNTESVLIIENKVIAEKLAETIEQAMNEDNSWRLELEDGDVYWYSGEQSWDSEPETGKWERMQSGFLQLLPIEKYL
ncbi:MULTISPECIES: phospholipase D family protein [Vibrio]|uniref:Phospholipase D family protein n=1 Tax=Vibrio cyclitrophicus ZF270 TaxID=1136176 RepID=A0AAN0LUA0_9VIBR|nr:MULTISPECIES: phospholipase D family protein [Vibrio]KNH11546.1 hydrolase [Vibrio lentus]MBY7659480.1 phospholipase D family protein [Vibrio atlanticus]ERM58283.1 Cardiolipin synthetase [Vibrio cyclitrophicus FF75]MBE8558220.1 phospholipase D family protein [Vibrio sp. OPT24]MBE8604214.1 phospholipase D family protein [Vibrio sp. OPT10]|tara:strand:- start:3688 stop:5220 length:1533 start_codon:yes stop_codon:yes gene_type:complete